MPISYRANSPHVVSETIDGESIVINLESGSYYSLRATAADVWGLVAPGATAEAIAAALATRYAGTPADLVGQISAFIARLRDEGLVVESPDARETAPGGFEADVAAPGARPPFAPPTFDRYEDLQDLLLADPIHEVGEGGWPTQLPPAARQERPGDEPAR